MDFASKRSHAEMRDGQKSGVVDARRGLGDGVIHRFQSDARVIGLADFTAESELACGSSLVRLFVNRFFVLRFFAYFSAQRHKDRNVFVGQLFHFDFPRHCSVEIRL